MSAIAIRREQNRRSLARGLAGQTLSLAAREAVDARRILGALHNLAPNRTNRERTVRRLRRLPGIVRAGLVSGGIVVVLREVLQVTLRKDGTNAYDEPRIAWTSVRVTAGRGLVGFALRQIQITRHAVQRMIERSACSLDGLLGQLDAAMLRALAFLDGQAPIRDGDDDYLPDGAGAWAGGVDATACDPDWGVAFRGEAPPIPVFSIHTFLGEEQLRPTVWLAWSRSGPAERHIAAA